MPDESKNVSVKEIRDLIDLLNTEHVLISVEDVIETLDILQDPSDNRHDWLVSKINAA